MPANPGHRFDHDGQSGFFHGHRHRRHVTAAFHTNIMDGWDGGPVQLGRLASIVSFLRRQAEGHGYVSSVSGLLLPWYTSGEAPSIERLAGAPVLFSRRMERNEIVMLNAEAMQEQPNRERGARWNTPVVRLWVDRMHRERHRRGGRDEEQWTITMENNTVVGVDEAAERRAHDAAIWNTSVPLDLPRVEHQAVVEAPDSALARLRGTQDTVNHLNAEIREQQTNMGDEQLTMPVDARRLPVRAHLTLRNGWKRVTDIANAAPTLVHPFRLGRIETAMEDQVLGPEATEDRYEQRHFRLVKKSITTDYRRNETKEECWYEEA